VTDVNCCWNLQDIEAMLKDKKCSKAPRTAAARERSEVSMMGDDEHAATIAADVGDSQQRAESAIAAAPKLSSAPQTVANSPCMTKTGLKEFVTVQLSAVTDVLALNPRQKKDPMHKAFKWPTKLQGSQVGASLTELTGEETVGVEQKACSSAFHIGTKRKKTS